MSPIKSLQRSHTRNMLFCFLLSLALWEGSGTSRAADIATLRDGNGNILCFIDDAGNLTLKGNLVQNAGTITENPAAKESYLKDSSSGLTLALYALDGAATGQLKIKGTLHAHGVPLASHASPFFSQVGAAVASFTSGGDLYLLGDLSSILAPTNLTATAVSCRQINLNWTKNSVNESGFKIESSPNGTGSWTLLTTTTLTTYSHTGLTAGAPYYYRVTAYRGAIMATSAVATAQTQTADMNYVLNMDNLTLTNPADYVDQYGNWYTSSNPWVTQTAVTHDGHWASQSDPNTENYNASAMSATVTGPGTLSFWWKLGDDSSGNLSFQMDNWIFDTLDNGYDWDLDTFQIPEGVHTVRWVYWNAGSGGGAYLDQVSFSANLAQAVNNPGLKLVTGDGGRVAWTTQTATTHDGGFAVRSGVIGDNTSTSLKSNVSGPGSLSFWWKISSEPGADYLRFFIDDVEQSGSIAGDVDWSEKTYSIPSGQHEVKWAYSKNGSGSAGLDCGWVDDVAFDVPLGQALNNSALDWQTYAQATDGTWPWFSQTAFTHDGSCAVQSGLFKIGDGYPSVPNPTSLQTSINGPGTLTFWWAISGASDSIMYFSIDGSTQDNSIYGQVDWRQLSYPIPAGTHTLEWTYIKDRHAAGMDCCWLDDVRFSTPAPGAPYAPVNLSAQWSLGRRINLTWTDNSANEDGFKIERSIGSTSFTQIGTAPANATTFQDPDAPLYGYCNYRVCAFRGTNDSVFTNTASARALAPPWPVQVMMVSDTQLSVTWHAVTDATFYTVWRSVGPDTTPTQIAMTSDLGILDGPGLSAGTLYYYSIKASDGSGFSDPSEPVSVWTLTHKPGTVTVQTLSNTSLRVSWPAVTGAVNYKVFRSTYENTSYTQVGLCSETSFADSSGLGEATRYWYKVQACSPVGISVFSDPASNWTAPNPPTGLSVHADDSTDPTRAMLLTWTDNSAKENGFVVERSPNGMDSWTTSTVVSSPGIGSAVVFRDDTNTTEGKHYWYRVKARLTQTP